MVSLGRRGERVGIKRKRQLVVENTKCLHLLCLSLPLLKASLQSDARP